MSDETFYEYMTDNQPCEYHQSAHDALAAMQPHNIVLRGEFGPYDPDCAVRPENDPVTAPHRLPLSDVTRMRMLALKYFDGCADPYLVRELAALALKLALDLEGTQPVATSQDSGWIDAEKELPEPDVDVEVLTTGEYNHVWGEWYASRYPKAWRPLEGGE